MKGDPLKATVCKGLARNFEHGPLAAAFDQTKARFLLISFTSDWLYPTYQSREIVSALRGRNIDVAFCELAADYGHDSFLLENKQQTDMVRGFLRSVEQDVVPA